MLRKCTMKKKILLTIALLLVTVSIANAGFIIPTQGQARSGNGLMVAIRSFFSSGACTPNWVASVGSCLVNNTRLVSYTDTNNCASPGNPPADNGTFHSACNYCSYQLSYNFTTECTYNENLQIYQINGTVRDINWGSCCNVTGLSSDCYQDDTSSLNFTYEGGFTCEEKFQMGTIAVALLLVGFMFWLIYTANTLRTTTDDGKAVPINNLVKIIMYGGAAFTAFIVIQVAYGFSITESLGLAITNTLNVQFGFVAWLLIILLFIILFGVMGNVGIKAIGWLQERFNPRKKRKNER